MTVLVNYKELKEAPHPMLNDYYVDSSKVIEVEELTDINTMFQIITNIKIL